MFCFKPFNVKRLRFTSRGGMYNGDVPLDSNIIPILLNAQISGIPTATQKQTYDFAVHITSRQQLEMEVDKTIE